MPSPRRPRRMEPDDRRAHLIRTALRVAARANATTIPLSDLTEEAAVSDGLLYHYFSNKQALLSAALGQAAEALIGDLGAFRKTEPFERVLELVHAYLTHVERNPESWLALTRTDSEPTARANRATESMLMDALGIEDPGVGLIVAMRGWLAFQREACAAWIEHPELQRRVLSNALIDALVVTLQATAWYDDTARAALSRLEAA